MLLADPPVVKDMLGVPCQLSGMLWHVGGLPERIGLDEDSLNCRLGVTNAAFHAVDGSLEFLHCKSPTKPNIDIEQHLIRTQLA